MWFTQVDPGPMHDFLKGTLGTLRVLKTDRAYIHVTPRPAD